MLANHLKEVVAKKETKMNYEKVTDLLEKISEIQKVLLLEPPSIPTNFGYVISRIFIYAAIIFFIGFYFFYDKKNRKTAKKIFKGIMLGYAFSSLALHLGDLFLKINSDEQNTLYFAPIELIQLAFNRNEFNSKKKEVLKEEDKILLEINKTTRNNPKFSDLETAKRFLDEKEKILKIKYQEEDKMLEKIISGSKKEVMLSIKEHGFLKKLNEDQLEYLAKAVAFRTRTCKNFSQVKIRFNEDLDNNLPDFFKKNPAVEDYINNLSEKVDKELMAEKQENINLKK